MQEKPYSLRAFRVAFEAGGITEVALVADGDYFVVKVLSKSGDKLILAAAEGKTPRRFVGPQRALAILHEVGVTDIRVDLREWRPGEDSQSRRKPHVAQAVARRLAMAGGGGAP